jgi:cytochrome c oxidase subunit 2
MPSSYVFLFRAAALGALVAATSGFSVTPRAQEAEEPRVIEVTASRFAFDPAVIDVAVGERVRLVMKSADGVHGLEIKKFNVKKEIPRGGEPVTVEFTADAPGRYPVLCSEYCGNGHDDMTGTLVVRAAGDAAP